MDKIWIRPSPSLDVDVHIIYFLAGIGGGAAPYEPGWPSDQVHPESTKLPQVSSCSSQSCCIRLR